jgi:hypothetical protein
LDAILFYGQRDLFLQDHTTLSVYSIFQTLGMNAGDGRNYAHFDTFHFPLTLCSHFQDGCLLGNGWQLSDVV